MSFELIPWYLVWVLTKHGLMRTLEQQQKKLQQNRAEKEFGVLSVRTLKNKAGMKKNTRMATRTQMNKAASIRQRQRKHTDNP
jgi:hypothetical protein